MLCPLTRKWMALVNSSLYNLYYVCDWSWPAAAVVDKGLSRISNGYSRKDLDDSPSDDVITVR